jgi:phenylacetate-CoA ligase
LRYRTGDLVKVDGKPCVCGRADMALVGGILGRTDDMIVVRGVNIYPGAVEEIIRATDNVVEYEVRVSTARALTELSLRIEPRAECADVAALVAGLEKKFQASFALRVPVSAVPPGTLPRFEMKAKRWIRND